MLVRLVFIACILTIAPNKLCHMIGLPDAASVFHPVWRKSFPGALTSPLKVSWATHQANDDRGTAPARRARSSLEYGEADLYRPQLLPAGRIIFLSTNLAPRLIGRARQ